MRTSSCSFRLCLAAVLCILGASATLQAAELVRIVSAASFEPITAAGSIVSLFGEGKVGYYILSPPFLR